jgi:hypothetical protein
MEKVFCSPTCVLRVSETSQNCSHGCTPTNDPELELWHFGSELLMHILRHLLMTLDDSQLTAETLKGGLQCQSPRWAAGGNRCPAAMYTECATVPECSLKLP